MTKILSAEEVCDQIDLYPNVLPEVARVMKEQVRKGVCPVALRESLRIKPIIMFEQTASFCQCGHAEDGHCGPAGACTTRWMTDKQHPGEWAQCPCKKFEGKIPMTKKEQERISKFMSLVLRHKPEAAFCHLTSEGWCSVSDLRIGMACTGHNVTDEELEAIVNDNDKKRFQFSPDGKRIRAVQGHSIDVDLGYRLTDPPEFLFHGTATRFLDSIKASGLSKGARQHVHLSATRETATTVGARHGKPAILIVKAKEMNAAGHGFYFSPNGVWLTDNVPAEFLSFDELFA